MLKYIMVMLFEALAVETATDFSYKAARLWMTAEQNWFQYDDWQPLGVEFTS